APGEDDSPSGTRRWRGRRGRGRGVRQRGSDNNERESSPREEQVQNSPVEAGSEEIRYDAPVIDKRVDETEATFARRSPASAPSPGNGRTLLPGESLSKYGAAPAAEPCKPQTTSAPAFKTNYTAPKPSTLIETPLTWDGSSLLPGESRAPRTKAPPEFGSESRPESDFAESQITEPQASEPVYEIQQEGDRASQREHRQEEPQTAASPATVEDSQPRAPEEIHEEVAPQPSAFIEAEAYQEIAPRHEAEPHHELEMHEEIHEFEPESASASHRVDTAAPTEFRVSSVAEVEEADQQAPGIEDHPSPELEVPEHDEQATEVADQLFGFAPGAGILEEEVIDDDEYDFEPIHVNGGEEHDSEDLEEETLEQSGEQLSDIVREEHLDRRLPSQTDPVESGLEVEEETEDFEYGETGPEDEEEDSIEEGQPGEESATADAGAPSRERDRGGERRGRRGERHGDRRGGRLGRRPGGGGGRHRASAQTMDLPIISDLLKQGQEILLQIAKEPIAKKGARVTSHIALPGRFLVFMPTVNHVGVSRKIASDEERQRLKRILISEKGDASGGFIVRTAADGASEDELRADLRFLISLWNDVKQREEGSKAPALIYHDLNLVERVLRDQVSDNFSTIWVDSEAEYERTVRFLNRFQPALVRRVKLYTKETPLFEHFGIQDEITKALKSKVWLKSGGSIVINQTEALVAIDINTGKYVGKTARLEDTILKTNLDAIPEIVRQIRLRDLGGIIVIDFIDMDERKNRHKVMAALEEALKADRAPSKVLQFNDFGLVAITRKRVKQSLERTLSVPCPVCAATGMVKSPTTVANEIYIELRKMQKHLDRGDVMLRVNPEVVKTLKANNARWLNELEEMLGKTIIVKSDPALHPEQFDIH
ncbi:MAG: Rne/Rng family ribonuclease, partial [Silvibacterium sp.]